MRENSLKKDILVWLRKQEGWVHGENITRYGQSLGYEGETARRRLRDLLKEGLVEPRWIAGRKVASKEYRAKPPVLVTEYRIPTGEIIHRKLTY